ncbi:MAG: hypothetical protein WBD03_07660 [Thermoplasmata archaeon]
MPFERKARWLSSSTVVVTIVAVFMVSAMLFVPAQTDAASQGTFVRGWIWDSEYRNVTGASVVVNMTDGGSTVSSKSDTTDEEGFYSVGFLLSEWDVGNEIWIIVTYEGKQDTNHTPAIDSLVQYVNLTYTFEIPEFGSVTGMAVAAFALGGVGVAAMVFWRRK